MFTWRQGNQNRKRWEELRDQRKEAYHTELAAKETGGDICWLGEENESSYEAQDQC